MPDSPDPRTTERPNVKEVVLVNDDRNDPGLKVAVLAVIGGVVMIRLATETEEDKGGAVTRTTDAEMFVSVQAFSDALAGLGFRCTIPAAAYAFPMEPRR